MTTPTRPLGRPAPRAIAIVLAVTALLVALWLVAALPVTPAALTLGGLP